MSGGKVGRWVGGAGEGRGRRGGGGITSNY